jgi:hypothetical protein
VHFRRERAAFDDCDLQCRSLRLPRVTRSSVSAGRQRRYTVSLRWKTTANVRARMRRSEVRDQWRA